MAGDLGITVAPAIRNIASGLPLATIVALADSAGIPDTVFESKKRDDPADEPERFVVPGRTQRDLLFVGTSLSGCVAHTAALMVNVELPPEKGAKGKRPRARSVAFSAPPCFSHGSEPSPRAKELLLHTTTIVAPHDEIFRLLILYQMVGTAREYFGQTLGEDIAEFRRLVHNVYNHDHRSAAKVQICTQFLFPATSSLALTGDVGDRSINLCDLLLHVGEARIRVGGRAGLGEKDVDFRRKLLGEK